MITWLRHGKITGGGTSIVRPKANEDHNWVKVPRSKRRILGSGEVPLGK
jgi:hypothetical protein